jgi:hypothetical protein
MPRGFALGASCGRQQKETTMSTIFEGNPSFEAVAELAEAIANRERDAVELKFTVSTDRTDTRTVTLRVFLEPGVASSLGGQLIVVADVVRRWRENAR